MPVIEGGIHVWYGSQRHGRPALVRKHAGKTAIDPDRVARYRAIALALLPDRQRHEIRWNYYGVELRHHRLASAHHDRAGLRPGTRTGGPANKG